MPYVGGKKYPYTAAGKQAAHRAKKKRRSASVSGATLDAIGENMKRKNSRTRRRQSRY